MGNELLGPRLGSTLTYKEGLYLAKHRARVITWDQQCLIISYWPIPPEQFRRGKARRRVGVKAHCPETGEWVNLKPKDIVQILEFTA